MIGRLLANTLVKTGPNAPLFDNPANHGLDYDDVEFDASDGVTLRGWLIPGDPGRVIIQSHFGLFCSRAGYTTEGKNFLLRPIPTDVEFLRQAKYFHDAGYTVLVYDFRNHGESDDAMDGFVTYGPEEAKDVIAAVDFATNHPTYGDASIGLMSICMGQGASVSAFGRPDGLKDRPNVRCMVSVQPLDYQHFLSGMSMPGFLQNRANAYIEANTDFDYYDNTWRPDVKNVDVPTLVIQNRNDGFLDEDFIQGVYDDLQVEKDLLWIELPKKRTRSANRIAAYDWIGTHPEPILGWFDRFVERDDQPTPPPDQP